MISHPTKTATTARLSVLSALIAALCACGSSPPTRFYTLSQIEPGSATAPATGDAVPVRVEPVTIPAELDRLELVTHTGPNQLHLAQFDRWAAPLDEQIRRILSADLAARLPMHGVVDPNEPTTGDPRQRLSVQIEQLDATENCAITLRVNWTLHASRTQSRSGSERIDEPASAPCPASLAAALSNALATFTDRLLPVLR